MTALVAIQKQRRETHTHVICRNSYRSATHRVLDLRNLHPSNTHSNRSATHRVPDLRKAPSFKHTHSNRSCSRSLSLSLSESGTGPSGPQHAGSQSRRDKLLAPILSKWPPWGRGLRERYDFRRSLCRKLAGRESSDESVDSRGKRPKMTAEFSGRFRKLTADTRTLGIFWEQWVELVLSSLGACVRTNVYA